MKIGILTFHNTTNYGAMYQTYALQKFLSKNLECEVIDYNNHVLRQRYDINPFNSKNYKDFIKKIINYHENKTNKRNFEEFKNKNLKVSDIKYNEKNIKKADSKYDSFIAGSDQIWNFNLNGNDENYFMTFTPNIKKRNSYAASFGISNFDKHDKTRIEGLLKNQNNISVREKQSFEFIKRLGLKKDFVQSIDPVFLLQKKEWQEIMSDISINEKYILVYEVAYVDGMIEFAKNIAREKGIKVYYASASNKRVKGVKNLIGVKPEDFLNYINNAEIIVTSSFHGMAMSIIFQKEFYYGLRESNEVNSRLESLALTLNVEDRDYKLYKKDEEINYAAVNKNIAKEVKKSKIYLKKIVRGKNSI